MFQHAAARRRLNKVRKQALETVPVSTRSRPKAADNGNTHFASAIMVSTRSRPKAADYARWLDLQIVLFQHAAARRRLTNVQV